MRNKEKPNPSFIDRKQDTSYETATMAMQVDSARSNYRVFHDLWTLLQEVISQVFVIKKLHLITCLILDSYGVMTAWNLEYKVKNI